jgi:drug/metabolite transporter (DMT)-like permease
MIAILFGLLSALSWGAGDFAGGLGSRRSGALRTVMLAEMWGLLLLLVSLIFIPESNFHWMDFLWSAVGGAAGALGLVVLYEAMTRGQMSIAAAVSSVTAAALPVLAGAVLEGLPGFFTLLGILLALLAIWLISQENGKKIKTLRISSLALPLLSGICFGIYFILMHQSSQQDVLWPIIAARIAGSFSLGLITLVSHQSWLPERSAWPYILLAGILDVFGNIFFIYAGRLGRLDTAAVLGSLYAGVTVIMALLFLKERITRTQGIGFLVALGAIILLTIQA